MISVLSIYSQNYGNRLQAYAMHKALAVLGADSVESLWVPIVTECKVSLLRRVLRKCKRAVMRVQLHVSCQGVRDTLFQAFTDDNIPTVKTPMTDPLSGHGGIFVIGSDQCWNPSWEIGSRIDGVQCATGITPNRKIAYAASFGISYDGLSSEWRERYSSWLSEFDPGAVSMREDAGASIVKELTGRDVPVVLDPTMLLTPEDWTAIEHKPQTKAIDLDKPFCLKYVLGDDVNGERIDALAGERGLGVVDLRDSSLPVGPAEFVWLIHHADLVCTDSFHASVFSTLFHRPFVIFERQEEGQCDMSSRFDTLARFTGLGDHRFNKPEFDWGSVWNCDWDAVDAKLSAERERSLNWLREALKRTERMRG